MSKYVREGLGKQWYETLLDIVGEAGATIVEGTGGKAAGDAVRGLHKGWTQAAFHRNDQPTVSQATPRPAPMPRSLPIRPPAPMPWRPPPPRPLIPQMAFVPQTFPTAIAQLPPARKSGSTAKTVLIIGGVGLGAAAIYLLARGHH